jgi:hypothetical protein
MRFISNALARLHLTRPEPLVRQGRARAAAVANYMAGQASSLRNAWDAAAQFGHPETDAEAQMLQAGAAAAEAMSNLLQALIAGDKELFKFHMAAFVNDAVDTGVVSV